MYLVGESGRTEIMSYLGMRLTMELVSCRPNCGPAVRSYRRVTAEIEIVNKL